MRKTSINSLNCNLVKFVVVLSENMRKIFDIYKRQGRHKQKGLAYVMQIMKHWAVDVSLLLNSAKRFCNTWNSGIEVFLFTSRAYFQACKAVFKQFIEIYRY